MKHVLLLVISICSSLMLLEVKAQEREQKRPATQTPSPSGATAATLLRGWVGKWDAVVAYVESGGRYTASWSSVEVTQPTTDTLVFTVKPPTGGRIFDCTLKRQVKSGKYLLTVESGNEVIQDLALQFTPESGFVGAGTFKNITVNASITRTEKGYKVSVTDPKLPEENNEIFGVEFLERK